MPRSSRPSHGARSGEPSLFAPPAASQPLAARMRPRTLDEVVGQRQLLAPGKPLRTAVERGTVGSLILWGPPGTGKTTLGRLVAQYTERELVPFSAVTEGVPRVREVVAAAETRLAEQGRGTILFVDEIHRLNRAQQDAFLPHVEQGTITLIGATTENPSFEVNGALLSRTRVVVLEPLGADDLAALIDRALADTERGLGARALTITAEARTALAAQADGDARRALTVLEAAAADLPDGGTITVDGVRDALQLRFAVHDRSGEGHFNLLSAFHKSLRGSDPQAALYWTARAIEGGEDPLVLFRRAIAMAAEDIGTADPQALQLAVAARTAFEVLGPPEGYLPLAEMVVYLATAPKSNASYRGLEAAREAARQTPGDPPPLPIRNAPTALMRELGYHAGYRYAHDSPEGYTPQEYLPERVQGSVFYEPGAFGFEREIAKRMAWWAELKRREGGEGEPEPPGRGAGG